MTEKEKKTIEKSVMCLKVVKARKIKGEVFYDVSDLEVLLNLIQKQDTEINKLKKEKEYYKKLYNESYNFLDPKFTGDHIPRID